MAKNKPEELIDHIIRFLNKERELYGDFSLPPDQPSSVEEPTKEDANAVPKAAAENKLKKKSTEGTTSSGSQKTATAGRSGPIEPQENLFEDGNDDSREIYRQVSNCNTLEELKELCSQAEVLRTDLQDTNLVFGVGNPDADLMLIGEAPGAEEDKQGEPFVGAAGQLLNKILNAIKFDRGDVYIANILKHRPPNNRNPKPEERQRSLPFLLRQIDLVNPKLILCLGKVSAQTLLDNEQSLSSMRGKFHTFRGKYELMATYHPAALLRHPKWKRPTWKDVQKLRNRYDELGGTP